MARPGDAGVIPDERTILDLASHLTGGARALHERVLRGLVDPDAPRLVARDGSFADLEAIAVYLAALGTGADLPTRLAWICDTAAAAPDLARRIDGWIDRLADDRAAKAILDARAAHYAPRPVLVASARFGLSDDATWTLDPGRAAVLVGTDRTLGARLLFQGPGDGRATRGNHAGLLGEDTFWMIADAGSTPELVHVLRAKAGLCADPRPRYLALGLGPAAWLAARSGEPDAVLAGPETPDHRAAVQVHTVPTPGERRATIAKLLTAAGTGASACLVRTADDAVRIGKLVRRDARHAPTVLTAGQRPADRAGALDTGARDAFAPADTRTKHRHVLICGDEAQGQAAFAADHLVMDVTSIDRLAARLTFLRRHPQSSVDVVALDAEHPGPGGANASDDLARRRMTTSLIADAPRLSAREIGAATPAAWTAGAEPRAVAARVEILACTSPTRPAPYAEHHAPPELGVERTARTTLVGWRDDVPELVRAGARAAREALDLYPPEDAELALATPEEVLALLDAARAATNPRPIPYLLVTRHANVWTRWHEGRPAGRELRDALVLLPRWAGGFDPVLGPSRTAPRRPPPHPEDKTRSWRFAKPGEDGAHGEGARLEVTVPGRGGECPQRLAYTVQAVPANLHLADTPASNLHPCDEPTDDHHRRVRAALRRIATHPGLTTREAASLDEAGRWYGRGRDQPVWQDSFENDPERALGLFSQRRTSRPVHPYRHEAGSLARATEAESFADADPGLALHLIAATGGWGRPGFANERAFDPGLTLCANLAADTAIGERFGALSARLGPWRLAWLEALVRSAVGYAGTRAKTTHR